MQVTKLSRGGTAAVSVDYTKVIGRGGKSRPVLILGRSGSGKSFSYRNLNPKTSFVFNIIGKDLPFKGGSRRFIDGQNMLCSDNYSAIMSKLAELKRRKDITEIVIDDFQYLMANEFMRRSHEKGYDKFTDMGRHAWDVLFAAKDMGPGQIIFILAHSDVTNEGIEKCKTIGKMLDEKVVVEGLFTIVLACVVDKGKYFFLTVNNGNNTVKAPPEMFSGELIDNDLKLVSNSVREFYQ
jgi:hypothetical protein